MNLSLGLDIGSRSIKLIELGFEGNSVGLVAAGSISTPPKTLGLAQPADSESIAQAIKRLIKETGVKSKEVHIALPESKVFTRVIEVPALSQRELTSAIQWEAEQYIPLPLDQVNLDFTVLRDAAATGVNKMEVLLVAAPKTLVDNYLSILESAELSPASAETEVIATTRALTRSVPNVHSVMIVSLGALTTDVAIVRNGILTFTRALAAGGDAFTRALAESLDFNLTQAEEYKRAYGVEPDKLEGKIAAAAKPITDTIVDELKRALIFYQEKYKEEHVQLVLLSGGSARMPGLVVYLAQLLGVEVQLANPWVGIAWAPRFNVLTTEGPNFCVAVGLALRR
jgi:type IV pilus assembly protein PilM